MNKITLSSLYGEFKDPQKEKAIEHIKRSIKLKKQAHAVSVADHRTFTTIGMLSLAKELEIISIEEYEALYNELFNN